MHGISPVLVFRSVAFASLLGLASCGTSAEETAPTTETTNAADTSATTEPADDDNSEETSAPDTSEPDITTVSVEPDSTTTEATREEPTDEVALVCSAYLDSISFGTLDEGLDALQDILGSDAPSGVQEALETLQNPDGDIEGFFAAQNSVDSYVLPICRDRFAASIVPAADDAAAAEAFVASIRDGDLAAAEMLAPSNVIVSFDWNGFPDATSEFSADNSTVTMLLEPTVTVFCQIADGAIEACAFGE